MKEEERLEQTEKLLAITIGHQSELSDDQLAAVKEFVEQVGGIENARQVIAALKELKKAA